MLNDKSRRGIEQISNMQKEYVRVRLKIYF